MKRLSIIIASVAIFIIAAEAQAQAVPVTDTVSPITTPHPAVTAHIDRPRVNLWAFIWIRWPR